MKYRQVVQSKRIHTRQDFLLLAEQIRVSATNNINPLDNNKTALNWCDFGVKSSSLLAPQASNIPVRRSSNSASRVRLHQQIQRGLHIC